MIENEDNQIKNDGTKQATSKFCPYDYKKMALIIGGSVMCLLAIVAIGISQVPDDYYKTTEQFSGELQMDEMNDEVMIWDNAYSDINSPKSQELVQKVKKKLSKAMYKEGISVDDIEITAIQPSEPKTIVKYPIAAESVPKGRWIKKSVNDKDVVDIESMSLEEIKHLKGKRQEYKDVSTLDIQYTTKGKPFQNAALFGSAVGMWHLVKHNLETDLAYDGMKGRMNQLKPTVEFMSICVDAMKNKPAEVKIMPMGRSARSAAYENVECDYSGKQVFSENHVICPGGCQDSQIFGGEGNVFAFTTGVCTAARYAGVIESYGGKVHAIGVGPGKPNPGPPKSGFDVKPVDVELPSFKVKGAGENSGIRPTEPYNPNTPAPPGNSQSGSGYFPSGSGYSPSGSEYGSAGGSGYSPDGSGYSFGGSGYSPGGSGYLPGGSGYSPGGSGYSPSGTGYSPGGSGYSPSGTGYSPGSSENSPGGSGYLSGGTGNSPDGSGYSPGNSGYSPGGSGYSPGGSGYSPGGGGNSPGGSGYSPGGSGYSPGGSGSSSGSGYSPGGSGNSPGGYSTGTSESFAGGGQGQNSGGTEMFVFTVHVMQLDGQQVIFSEEHVQSHSTEGEKIREGLKKKFYAMFSNSFQAPSSRLQISRYVRPLPPHSGAYVELQVFMNMEQDGDNFAKVFIDKDFKRVQQTLKELYPDKSDRFEVIGLRFTKEGMMKLGIAYSQMMMQMAPNQNSG